jgi:WD40 repeat protein
MSLVFLSYSHDDREYADRLERFLVDGGLNVWRDDRIRYGSQWLDEIERQLGACDAMVLVMSEAARQSTWVKEERTFASDKKIPIFPLLLDGEPWFGLRTKQYSDVRSGDLPPPAFLDDLISEVAGDRGTNRPGGVQGESVERVKTAAAGPPTQPFAKIRTLEGHTGWVSGCAVAPDGSYIVSASWDETLLMWDPATGSTMRTLEGHTYLVSGCAVAPDGSYIVSASSDRTLRMWDPATGSTIRTLEGHTKAVSGCEVAPDGSYIVSGSGDKTLLMWDPATGSTIRTLEGHTYWVSGCAVAPDGSYIVSGSGDDTLRMWDPATGSTIRTL